MINVTVWNEFIHEKEHDAIRNIYPNGIHNTIKEGLDKTGGFHVKTAVLEEPDHGLTEEVLKNTDVLIWWGHAAHEKVEDRIVERVYNRVMEGMGLVVLHSGHASKVFQKLMGTNTQKLKWRESGDKEVLWLVSPGHPIAAGLEKDHIILDKEETYGEFFNIPAPDEIIFMGWFSGGEVFRSGVTFKRGRGRIFYFQPGHETFPIYHNQEIKKIIANGVTWAAPNDGPPEVYDHYKSVL